MIDCDSSCSSARKGDNTAIQKGHLSDGGEEVEVYKSTITGVSHALQLEMEMT